MTKCVQWHVSEEVANSLWSAYFPVIITGFSLIICFWAEVSAGVAPCRLPTAQCALVANQRVSERRGWVGKMLDSRCGGAEFEFQRG